MSRLRSESLSVVAYALADAFSDSPSLKTEWTGGWLRFRRGRSDADKGVHGERLAEAAESRVSMGGQGLRVIGDPP